MSEHTDEPAEPVEPDDWRPWEHYTGVDPLPDDPEPEPDDHPASEGWVRDQHTGSWIRPAAFDDDWNDWPHAGEVSGDATEAEGEA